MLEYRHTRVLLASVALGGLCLVAGLHAWVRQRGPLLPPPVPSMATAPPYTPWPTPPTARAFDYPLLPAASYGPYVQGVTGPLAADTRYGAQNPAQGNRANCFRDAGGRPVPFRQLYHAGVDLFALDEAGRVAGERTAHVPVHAVADGVVRAVLSAGSEGHVIISEHLLAGGAFVYAVYWHVDHVQVQPGQPVERGQALAVVRNVGLNSHLHWEMRTFFDGSDLFPAGTAGARGTCNGHAAGVGYTWDDDPARARPGFYGYLDPVAFVESRRPTTP